jgi:protein-S-isoprenylcysteine O-methyltransferase Ste14
MYIAWTLISLGVALVGNTPWPVVLLPGVLIYTHVCVILREERYLEQKFGDEYRQYRAGVRRYV